MDADALTPRDLFDTMVCHEVPPFQRPYVWTEEDQWQPLWEDIERLAEAVLAGEPDAAGSNGARTHFLGAVVLKQLENATRDPARRSVIDGQQRLTTLQLLLDAAQYVVGEYGDEDDAESLRELVINAAKRFEATPKRFKLWPSRIDRDAFERVMDDAMEITPAVAEARIAQAHRFFSSSIHAWADVTGDPAKASARLGALADVLQQRLQIVVIDLDTGDDDQLIFETLNDRGTPLLAADLIKNFVFQACEELEADVDAWADKYWQDFDGDWWRDQVAQGRLYRSRIDLFLQYWLTMQLLDEIPTDALFSRFRNYAGAQLTDVHSAEAFLAGLRRDADTFRDFAELDPDTPSGRFYTRVVEALELGALIPLLLWMVRAAHGPPQPQADRALAAVESWAVRRTLLRRTMKDVNKLVVALLRELDQHPLDEVGDASIAYLQAQTADAREWPTDEQLLEELPKIKVYGNIKQQRLRTILGALELQLRTERSEKVPLPPRLEIEHIMPRGWRSHWGQGVVHDAELSARREALVNTIGNLTLVTKKLNIALSNRPWTNAEASTVAPTGKDAGVGKWSLLKRYTLLALNKEIVDEHEVAWTDDDIVDRAGALTRMITRIWPYPTT